MLWITSLHIMVGHPFDLLHVTACVGRQSMAKVHVLTSALVKANLVTVLVTWTGHVESGHLNSYFPIA